MLFYIRFCAVLLLINGPHHHNHYMVFPEPETSSLQSLTLHQKHLILDWQPHLNPGDRTDWLLAGEYVADRGWLSVVI